MELSSFNFGMVDLTDTNLSETTLHNAYFLSANLSNAILTRVRSKGAYFSEAILRGADLRGALLYSANFSGADLTETRLEDANLTSANILRSNFSSANLTGACIEDWQFNNDTLLEGAVCKYIYLKKGLQERRPHSGEFQSGEFAALFQKALDTVDLIFKDGIDWYVFLQSFQELRRQYTDHNLSVQAIEKKRGDAFVIRLEVSSEINKAEISSGFRELYDSQVQALEAQYEKQLQLQGKHLEDARSTIEVERQEKAILLGLIEVLANNQQGPKYDMRGAQIAGGVADVVGESQAGGTINNQTFNTPVGNVTDINRGTMIAHMSHNTEDIIKLIASLQEVSQSFPANQKELVKGHIEDLNNDLNQQIRPSLSALKQRIVGLLGVAIAISGTVATATDFANNVLELSNKLEVPVEAMQPQLEEFKKLQPDFEW